MARTFNIGPGHLGYNLDEHEEVMLLNAWLATKKHIADDDAPNMRLFRDHFFGEGKGVSERVVAAINKVLKKAKKGPLRFVDAPATAYMQKRGAEKVALREKILNELQDKTQRARVITPAFAQYQQDKVEYELLPDARAESGSDSDADDGQGLSGDEVARRAKALMAARQAQQVDTRSEAPVAVRATPRVVAFNPAVDKRLNQDVTRQGQQTGPMEGKAACNPPAAPSSDAVENRKEQPAVDWANMPQPDLPDHPHSVPPKSAVIPVEAPANEEAARPSIDASPVNRVPPETGSFEDKVLDALSRIESRLDDLSARVERLERRSTVRVRKAVVTH